MSESMLLLMLAFALFTGAVFFTRRALIKGSQALNRRPVVADKQ